MTDVAKPVMDCAAVRAQLEDCAVITTRAAHMSKASANVSTIVTSPRSMRTPGLIVKVRERERRQRCARRHEHVLTAVDHVGDRSRIERGAGLEMPEVLSRACVERHEVARRASEDQVCRGGQHAGPGLTRVGKLPAPLAGRRIDGAQRTVLALDQALYGAASKRIAG